MVKRINEYLKQQNIEIEGKKILLAVSGGADSVCLLDCVYQLQDRLSLKLVCVHINHGLRETAARDEEFVNKLAAEREIPLYVLHADVLKQAKESKCSTEEAGRKIRYEFFDKIAQEEQADYIFLAHHRDDNAETMLFNLFRGSSIRGLGGIRPIQGRYVRPLLEISRKEIEEYLLQRGIVYVTDETNLSDLYSRNRIRHHILPAAEDICQGASGHISETAIRLSEIEEYLALETMKIYAEGVEECKDGVLIREDVYRRLHCVPAGRLIYEVLIRVAGTAKDIGSVHVEALKKLWECNAGKKLDLPYELCAHRTYDGIYLLKKTGTSALAQEEYAALKEGTILLEGVGVLQGKRVYLKDKENFVQKRYTKCFDYDRINCCPVFRRRKEGDYLIIHENGARKSLNRYLIDEKVPACMRDSIWVLADGSHVMWVIGYRISSAYKVRKNTENIMEWHVAIEEDRR